MPLVTWRGSPKLGSELFSSNNHDWQAPKSRRSRVRGGKKKSKRGSSKGWGWPGEVIGQEWGPLSLSFEKRYPSMPMPCIWTFKSWKEGLVSTGQGLEPSRPSVSLYQWLCEFAPSDPSPHPDHSGRFPPMDGFSLAFGLESALLQTQLDATMAADRERVEERSVIPRVPWCFLLDQAELLLLLPWWYRSGYSSGASRDAASGRWGCTSRCWCWWCRHWCWTLFPPGEETERWYCCSWWWCLLWSGVIEYFLLLTSNHSFCDPGYALGICKLLLSKDSLPKCSVA